MKISDYAFIIFCLFRENSMVLRPKNVKRFFLIKKSWCFLKQGDVAVKVIRFIHTENQGEIVIYNKQDFINFNYLLRFRFNLE